MRNAHVTEANRSARIRVLLVGGGTPDPDFLETAARHGFAVTSIRDWGGFEAALADTAHDLTVIDDRLRWASMRDLAQALCSAYPGRPIIVLTDGDGEVSPEALSEAWHVCLPRGDLQRLPIVIAECLARAARAHARTSRALRDSEAEFRGLFELSAVGTAQADPETGRFLRVNRRFCEITGYKQAELLSKTFQDITHPDDRAGNAAAIGLVLRRKKPRWEIEKRYVRADGSVVWVLVSGQLVTGPRGRPYRLVANAVDVSDRKRAEEALLASRKQLQVVTDGAPVLLANCGRDYRFKFVNRAYADRYSLEPRDVVGRSFAEIAGEEAFEQLKPYADRALRGESSEFEAEVCYRDLGRQWIRCAYAPEKDPEGNIVGWVAAVLDITDRKRAEEALREADRRKDEFLAVLSHELRNPLAALRAGLELIGDAERTPQLLEKVRAMMERQLGHLIRLVDDLLEVARISRGEIELRRVPLDLHEVIDAAVDLARPLIVERRHSLVLRHAQAPLAVEADSQRLTQVVGNLLSNAARYTQPEGTISLSTAVENGQASVSVKDNGYGIPPERIGRVFDMFSQVPEHRELTGGGGLGIGLALARQLVTLHEGTIEAQSAGLGQGSEFIVRLPLIHHMPAHRRSQPQPPDDATPARRILVVDDNVDAADGLTKLLELEGHAVQAAYSAASALEAVARGAPDVVLLDIGLPEMDGYEVARRVRRMSGGEHVALYAVTGWTQEEDKRRALEAGFDAHLTKPVDMARLRKWIARAAPRSPI